MPLIKEASKVFPIPEIVLEHHLKTLKGPMGEWRKKKRLPPVLLFTGIPGVGKRTMAHHLAQWILCESSGFAQLPDTGDGPSGTDLFGNPVKTSEPPCGECPSCQKALKGSWVDFNEISPEDDGPLKIEQFRQLKQTLGYGAHEGAYKINLICNADRMTVQAANSVLKLLEEPPRGWLFFLTASDPTVLLPTIVSRCQTIRLKPFDSQNICKLLSENSDQTRVQVCSLLSQGSWERAFMLARDDIWEQRKTLFSFLKNPASHLSSLVDWASQEPSHFEILIDQLESICADLIHYTASSGAGNVNLANQDAIEILKAHATSLAAKWKSKDKAREFWISRVESIASARELMHAPLNRKLVIQDILLPFLKIT